MQIGALKVPLVAPLSSSVIPNSLLPEKPTNSSTLRIRPGTSERNCVWGVGGVWVGGCVWGVLVCTIVYVVAVINVKTCTADLVTPINCTIARRVKAIQC